MFYAHLILSKKGPLAKVWLAAHWDKKLTKAQIYEADVKSSVDSIKSPQVKMALRTSGHLLLGVVRIYSRKAKYLLTDCSDAFVKIKMAFRPGVNVDLPKDSEEAAANAVTLPEVFHDFNLLDGNQSFDLEIQLPNINQSRAEEITMKDDFGQASVIFAGEDGFGEMPMDDEQEREILRHAEEESSLYDKNQPVGVLDESRSLQSKHLLDDKSVGKDSVGLDNEFLEGEGFGMDIEAANLFDNDDNAFGDIDEKRLEEEEKDALVTPVDITLNSIDQMGKTGIADDTTLIRNDQDQFVLEPLDMTQQKINNRIRRKRKLIVDTKLKLSKKFFEDQLKDSSDIVHNYPIEPATKKALLWKGTLDIKRLFQSPIHECYALNLSLHPRNHMGDDRELLREHDISIPSPRMEDDYEKIVLDPTANENDETAINDEQLNFDEGDAYIPEEDVSKEPLMESKVDEMPEVDLNVSLEPEFTSQDGAALTENHRWQQRRQRFLESITKIEAENRKATFFEICKKSNKKQAAVKFYTLLLLAKQSVVNVKQSEIYGDIAINKR
ncbi:Double-strand-break repair protein rad21-like protein [Trichoplax sp. H2]|nr:Double-strand-break repair protein rad21-like protein [Trichoplax sp. H2]|eukprot:RDD44723.1 Double-strand-break repair protein rad21-like protein [Trichoplax sp. H2]